MSTTKRNSILCSTFLLTLALGACTSGGGGSQGGAGLPGQTLKKPDGSDYVVDENQGGRTTRLQLVEILWGRLVDVHDLDAAGEVDPIPVFRDWVINENVQSDSTNYLLETNPITLATRLVILRDREGPNLGNGTFEELLREASGGLPPITAKNDDGTSAGPFSFMARNGCMMVRFNDALDDSPAAEAALLDTVKVLTGYPPKNPFQPRLTFDPNHGVVLGDQFHSTRLLVDMTVSDTEARNLSTSVPVNTIGLPASLAGNPSPSISLRIPTRVDPGSGQFKLLRGVSGVPLSSDFNGPVDRSKPTLEVVRAFRAGNVTDANNGFLLDLNPPQIVGSWSVSLANAVADPTGRDGFDFVVDVTFGTVCENALRVGDTLSVGDLFLEVTEATSSPTNSLVTNVKVRALVTDPLPGPGELFGSGFLQSTYEPTPAIPTACWLTFSPQPGVLPAGEVSTTAQSVVRFSEPMDPRSVTPFETFMTLRGGAGAAAIEAENVVVGTTASSSDLKEFSFTSLLPLSHQQGSAELFNIRLDGVTDLAGNQLALTLPPVEFTIDPDEPSERNASVVMRFSDLDEVKPTDVFQGSLDDLRGQVFYDFERGVIRPRDPLFTSYAADRTNPVPAIMIPFPPGIQTPLSALGSKLMTLWRYADLGWNAADETKYDVDVVGLWWSPIGGLVLRDFFNEFEIRLSHSRYQPDEDIDQNLLPKWRNSGLRNGPAFFTDNILIDPIAGQEIVHPKSLGYIVDPADLRFSPTGTPLMPYPLNRAGQDTISSYTWRNTAGDSTGAPSGAGVPLDIEAGAPLNIVPGGDQGSLWGVNKVRTAGLPLLMEFRCYPSDSGIGLNPLDISLAINSSVVPNFRCFSTGGVNQQGKTVKINPDTELAPTGGFNPSSSPPGRKTRFNADNSFYIGQLDVVTRISRAHTVWIDTLYEDPIFFDPITIPAPSEQPNGTEVLVDFRGADSFGQAALLEDRAFTAGDINAYGNVQNDAKPPTEVFVGYNPDSNWRSSVSDIDSARYFQMRFTFVNDIDNGLSPELSAIGVAFVEE